MFQGTCSYALKKYFVVFTLLNHPSFPVTDSGIGEQKANPHWVDQGSYHLSFLFFLFSAAGPRGFARINLNSARIQFPGQLFYSS